MSQVYRQFEFEGFTILVGRGARQNDELSLHLAEPQDLWLHAAGYAGSHVVIRVPSREVQVPVSVVEVAPRLAAWNSKARGARGKVEVHLCRAGEVRKRKGAPAGEVLLERWTRVRVYFRNPFPEDSESSGTAGSERS